MLAPRCDNAAVQRRFVVFLVAAALYIPALLLADSPGLVPQLALGLATAAFLYLFARNSRVDSWQIICAILVATTGEIVLSLGWGLYTYRNALIPLYVPFGHGVFYALAAESAMQERLQAIAPKIVRGVLIAGSVIAAFGFIVLNDQWGLLWWIAAAALLMRARNQLLLSTCFVYTILLEWIVTAIGNWHWTANVPGAGLHSANPPSGVGILYILLDLITMAICSRQRSRSSVRSSRGWKLWPVPARRSGNPARYAAPSAVTSEICDLTTPTPATSA